MWQVVEATTREGAAFVDHWFIGCGATHVVCEGPSILRYIGHTNNLVTVSVSCIILYFSIPNNGFSLLELKIDCHPVNKVEFDLAKFFYLFILIRISA